MQLTGSLFVLAGALFLFLGALGLVRMPDLYNRMQAGTKTSTLGSILFLAGLIFFEPHWWGKLTLLILLLMLTNPVSSHALARAAHKRGVRLTRRSVRDDLHNAEQLRSGEGES
jgi:multicomponent Na+:H+ antiporter subunit G